MCVCLCICTHGSNISTRTLQRVNGMDSQGPCNRQGIAVPTSLTPLWTGDTWNANSSLPIGPCLHRGHCVLCQPLLRVSQRRPSSGTCWVFPGPSPTGLQPKSPEISRCWDGEWRRRPQHSWPLGYTLSWRGEKKAEPALAQRCRALTARKEPQWAELHWISQILMPTGGLGQMRPDDPSQYYQVPQTSSRDLKGRA